MPAQTNFELRNAVPPHPFALSYRVDTTINADGLIIQELLDPMGEKVTRWICNTRDQQIRAALISLGWTPPKPACSGG